jgi:succinate---hydroxymethylglutarate CoA-transferase
MSRAASPAPAIPRWCRVQLYTTRDGWIFVMCNKEKFWPALCDAIGRPEWGRDERYRTFKERLARRDEITALLDEALSQRTTAQWLEVFAGRVPAAPIHDIEGALENPFVTEHGRLQTLEHPERGSFRLVAPPVRCPGEPAPARPGPGLGEHTRELLEGLGYEAARIDSLAAQGVV